MKSDLYTKFVLTVIAPSLSVIAIQLTTKDAHAQYEKGAKLSPSGALIVTICDPIKQSTYGVEVCANVHSNDGLKVNALR